MNYSPPSYFEQTQHATAVITEPCSYSAGPTRPLTWKPVVWRWKIFKSRVCVYDICFYIWSHIWTTHSCYYDLYCHSTPRKIMIYAYMICWYMSGCCSFEGCQILGHCEEIFTIQQCFPCSNVVTLRRIHYQRRDCIRESGSMFWSFMRFGIEYSRTWRCISECSELIYSRSTCELTSL